MSVWEKYYAEVPKTFERLKSVKGVLTAFNSNIDAIKKITPQTLQVWINEFSKTAEFKNSHNEIKSQGDFLRGVLDCFSRGAAAEWLITEIPVYEWLQKNVGYDHLQMGGQGGIIANVMAVCGVQKVYAHAASLAPDQIKMFVDEPNLLLANSKNQFVPARKAVRANDKPLIHWILEFKKDDEITFNGEKITCPKSNRFIATYDPLNFELVTDEHFNEAASHLEAGTLQYIVLSGYQLLRSPAMDVIRDSWKKIGFWKKRQSLPQVHIEVASTQDKTVLKDIIEFVAFKSESIGFNEQELVLVLKAIDEVELAEKIDKKMDAVNLFEGMLKLQEKIGTPRMQLHFFGCYLTLLAKNYWNTLEKVREGMLLAATIAASKAGTGTIDKKENLMWGMQVPVGDVGLKHLGQLHDYLNEVEGQNTIKEHGLFIGKKYDVVAIPSKIVDKPITLVGMGDTISSLSLIGSH